ncbi:hypothetical protein IE077_000023, partial [Cardiosporidium cionae]
MFSASRLGCQKVLRNPLTRVGMTSLTNPLGMALFHHKSAPRWSGNHIILGRPHDTNPWEPLPTEGMENIIPQIQTGPLLPGRIDQHGIIQTPSEMQGSGLHGPEHPDVMKLCLWNRLKMKQPQRAVPTLLEQRDHYKLEISCVWLTWSFLLFYVPMAVIGGNYATEHDHFPWMPPRTDGSH